MSPLAEQKYLKPTEERVVPANIYRHVIKKNKDKRTDS